VDGWMDEWMIGWMVRWKEVMMDEGINVGWMHPFINKLISEIAGWQIAKWTYKFINQLIIKYIHCKSTEVSHHLPFIFLQVWLNLSFLTVTQPRLDSHLCHLPPWIWPWVCNMETRPVLFVAFAWIRTSKSELEQSLSSRFCFTCLKVIAIH
jgi:hypothetical protein